MHKIDQDKKLQGWFSFKESHSEDCGAAVQHNFFILSYAAIVWTLWCIASLDSPFKACSSTFVNFTCVTILNHCLALSWLIWILDTETEQQVYLQHRNNTCQVGLLSCHLGQVILRGSTQQAWHRWQAGSTTLQPNQNCVAAHKILLRQFRRKQSLCLFSQYSKVFQPILWSGHGLEYRN